MAEEAVQNEIIEEEVSSAETEIIPVEKKAVRSGASREMANANKSAKPVEVEKPVENKTYDYTYIKDLSSEDYKKYEPIKSKYGEDLYYQTIVLANDVKKQQRLVAERERELNTYKSAKPEEELSKYREFTEGMRKDAIGTYKRFQKEFNLPDSDFLEKQISSGSTQDRLEQWQDNELVPKIEKRFKLDADTFLYDPSEAYKAGTPSYEYRVATERKEQEFNNEYEQTQSRQREVITTVKQQLDEDMKYLKETFFAPSNYEVKNETGNVINAEEANKKADEMFTAFLTKLDENQNAIKEGKFSAEQNPYSLRVIFRGTHFDELAKAREDKAIASIHKQYNAKGLYLPSNENPTDATKVKSKNINAQSNETRRKFSPAFREISRNSKE